jgi:hypothetical protein
MNPGNLKTELRRHLHWIIATFFGWMSWDPVYGAYTELFAGFSPDITPENSGCWGMYPAQVVEFHLMHRSYSLGTNRPSPRRYPRLSGKRPGREVLGLV